MNKDEKEEIIRRVIAISGAELTSVSQEQANIEQQKAFLDALHQAMSNKAEGLLESIEELKDIERRVGLGEL